MDIQIVNSVPLGETFIEVYRTFDTEHVNVEKMHSETLAIRAAEYDLDPEDPFVLDLVLLERFYVPRNLDEVHPLFRERTVKSARDVMENRVERVREKHGAPADPVMRSLFSAADVAESTQGLTDVKAQLIEHADMGIAWAVQQNRDAGRAQLKMAAGTAPTLGEQIRQRALARAWTEAQLEQQSRRPVPVAAIPLRSVT